MTQKKALLIDAYSIIFRAYYATAYRQGEILRNKEGIPTNAVFCLYNMFKKFLKNNEYTHILACFDAGKKTPRHLAFKEYKANRSQTPEELIQQFPIIKEFFQLLGITIYQNDELEADDIVAVMSKRGINENISVEVLSSDKDLLQLVSDNTTMLLVKKGISDVFRVDPISINMIYDNITANQIPDLKALMGDSSDNFPGVKGVGEKTALELVRQYGSIEGIYENIENIKGALKDKLVNGKENAFFFKKLATLVTQFDINIKFSDLEYNGPKDKEKLNDFFKKYDFNVRV